MRTVLTRRRRSPAVAVPVRAAHRPVEQLEARTLFASVTWNGSSSALWSDAGNWVGGAVPTSADDVIFPAGPATLLVNVDAPVSVNGITFNGAGYELSGNYITLGSGGISATAAGGDTVSSDLDFGNGNHLDVASGSSLVVNGN